MNFVYRMTVTCWKCYIDLAPAGKNDAFLSASTTGTPQEIKEAGWKLFFWIIRPSGMDPRFWLCPKHTQDPPKGSEEVKVIT